MRTAGDEDHILAGMRELRAKVSAGAASAEDRYAHPKIPAYVGQSRQSAYRRRRDGATATAPPGEAGCPKSGMGNSCRFHDPAISGGARRVEMWRSGGRSNISVAAPFVWRCLTGP